MQGSPSRLCFFLLFSALLAMLCSCGTYQTSSTRTQTVQTLCSMFSARSELVSDSDESEIKTYNTAMKASFSVTGNELFSTIIQNSQKPTIVLQKYPNLKTEYGVFVAPFLLAFIILIPACLCSCCCCCCACNCCPPKCCRKADEQPFSKCQLIWPGVVTFITLGLILGAGAAGLTKAKGLQSTVQAVGCSVAISIDDIINGNITSNGKFFMGLGTLNTSISSIKSNLTDLSTQMNSIVSQISNVQTAFNTATDSIAKIPTGVAGGSITAFSYATPFNAVPSGAASALLPGLLGDSSSTSNYIGGTISVLTTMQSSIDSISTTAGTLATAASGTSFSSALDTASTALSKIVDTLKSGDQTFYNTYSMATPILPTVTTAMTGIYAGLVAISCVGILALGLLLICNMYKCRFLMYFVCFILAFIGLASLLIATIFSAIIPVLYFTCDFTTASFGSGDGFTTNFGTMADPSMISLFTICLPGGSGDLLGSSSLLAGATSSLTDLRNTMNNITSFDSTAVTDGIQTAFDPLYNVVNDYYSGKSIDFGQTGNAGLDSISQPTNYASCSASVTAFASDSWVPYSGTGGAISCKGGSSAATCTLTTFEDRSCSGCFDAAYINSIWSDSTTFAASLTTRYNSMSCAGFIADMTRVYDQFYDIKKTQYSTSNVVSRTATAQTDITAYKSTITTLSTTFTNVINSLKTQMDSITDPDYGIIAGFNCLIIGDDINLVTSTVCAHGFKVIFFLRTAFGIAGFAILFSVCCISCTGSRHYLQNEHKNRAKLQVEDMRDHTQENINGNNGGNQSRMMEGGKDAYTSNFY